MKDLKSYLDFTPNHDQQNALNAIQRFLELDEHNVFILDGSAGTGKTTVVKAVVDSLLEEDAKLYLSAPTGRAAKILGKKAGFPARTNHSLIYDAEPLENGGVKFNLSTNEVREKTVFIIDEASMISDQLNRNEFFLTFNSLLSDLFKFVRQGHKENKVVFIGDKCQLPPVSTDGFDFSPALSKAYLERHHACSVTGATLRQVMRQEGGSRVLDIATSLRDGIENGTAVEVAIPQFQRAYQGYGYFKNQFDATRLDNICVIAYTNRDVNHWNKKLRLELHNSTLPLISGEHVILDSNWMSGRTFLMKGEGAIVEDVSANTESYAGLKFQDVTISVENATGERLRFKSKCLIDVLQTDNGNLHPEQEKALVAESKRRNKIYRESGKINDDPYVGALRLRYGYALTCHKAQGGEWEQVLVHPYLPQGNAERWLYTAITRARNEVISWPGFKAA